MSEGLAWLATPAFAGAVIQLAVPLWLALLGAQLCERAGLVNLGLEGMLLAGACVGAALAVRFGPGAGIAFGVIAGVWLALLHALVTIQFGVDQIVSGLAVNLLAFGAARPLAASVFAGGVSPRLRHLPAIPAPWPGGLSPLVPLALLIGIAVLLALRFGVTGPRLDAAASAPPLARGAGLDTDWLRYRALIVCGALAGLAGAALPVELVGHYQPDITQGRGFLALALCVLAGRSLLRGLLGAVLLAAVQAVPAFLPVGAATSLLLAAPWAVVLLALALLGRGAHSSRAGMDRWRAGITL